MKLDNHGWGLNQMLIYCAILLFFLLIAIFFIVQLSRSLGDTLKDAIAEVVTYSEVEENIKSAAKSYMEKYYHEEMGTGTITITADNLLKYDMLDEKSLTPTEEKKSCIGYALVKKDNNEQKISSYIKCKDYETNNYQSWRLGE